jgi:hypothetical protein
MMDGEARLDDVELAISIAKRSEEVAMIQDDRARKYFKILGGEREGGLGQIDAFVMADRSLAQHGRKDACIAASKIKE